MRRFNLILLFILMQSGAGYCAAPAYELYLKGELLQASSAYLALADADPENPRPMMNAAACLKQAGRYYDAARIMVKALERDPQNPDIYSELGWLRFHQADYEGARSAFEIALKIQILHSRAELGLASVYSNLDEKEKTLAHLEKYRQLRPDFSGVDYILAWNYMNFKMHKEAEEALVEALRKDPSFTEARLPLAGIYARQGKFNEAWNQYYRVLDYAPGHPVASKMMKVLEGKLTKQPEEIRPPFRITKPLVMEPLDALASLSSSVKIRVGIGTGNTGKQGRNNLLRIKSFEGLTVTGKASGKVYATIPPDETWTVTHEGDKVALTAPDGTVFGRFAGAVLVKPVKTGGSVIFDATSKTKNPWFSGADRQYRGYIELFPNGGRGVGVVNVIENELYLLGVVPSEVAPQWPYESLKAQAVIARTQVLIRRARGGQHKKDGYHLCDGQHCQAYKGKSNEANTTTNAVVETEGEILTYHGRPAYTFYHSNCGGWVQASKEVTGWGDSPYLVTKPDIAPDKRQEPLDPWDWHLWITGNPQSNCNYPGRVRASEYRWMKIIRQKDMTFRINMDYKIGELVEIIPLRRSPSGNVNTLKLVGRKKSVTVTKEHLIRNLLGFSSLKSTLFEIEINRFKNGKVRNYWLYGGGWGHAIGMCQSGAAGLAGKYDMPYKGILDFYFPGTSLRTIKYVKKVK
ncbi:MAG: SpoIID/LytB domain-containing protein [Elusimicrobiota bacterium]|nr:SpoIID/LytB domain-containing protein [Elusimicrobiota bacterium]